MNVRRSEALLAALAGAGVQAWCMAPGGRNSPLVSVLHASTHTRIYTFYEERSAAFFALGLARSLGAPVGVLTTSGTAAAEVLPAAIEACYSGVPLVLVTADRPKRLRGTGAPQAIEQPGLLHPYAPTVLDSEGDVSLALEDWNRLHPVHVNVCFEEPLLDAAPNVLCLEAADTVETRSDHARGIQDLEAFLRRVQSPLVLAGALEARDTEGVRSFLLRLGAPVLAEGHSQLREDPELGPLLLRSGEALLPELPVDGVLRIGGVPVLRYWRDLEETRKELPVFSVARTSFRGMSRGQGIQGPPGEVLTAVTPERAEPLAPEYRRRDRDRYEALQALLAGEPRSEPALVHHLSKRIPTPARIFLGNSLPVREWDLFAAPGPGPREIHSSRGACGIDGQISTFLGLTRPGVENWALVGDLTALYDLGAPWIIPHLGPRRLRIAILNNGGGRIFSRMFENPVFQNEHAITFEAWARMWDLHHEAWEEIPDTPPEAGTCILEVKPDPGATHRFWAAYERLVKAS